MSNGRFVDSPPAGAEGWRDVWENDRRYRPRGSKVDFLLRFVRRWVNRANEAEDERQRNFNVVVLELLDGVRGDVARARDDLKRDLEQVQRDVRAADEALAEELRRIRELIPVAARRNDALIAALDQKIESVAARLRDITNPVIAALPSTAAADLLYRRLEDGLRGPVDVAGYVALLRDHAPVIDAGCGRGELLAALREAGITARGFDTNERSVADLRARGLEAEVAGVPACFAGIADGSLGAVVAMHVVEHIPVDALFALFAESARVLRAGGLLIIETPNAESITMSASEFWRDPTHLAPRHAAALTLLAREYGFTVGEARAIHPFPAANRFPQESDALNDRLFGGQDLRLVLRKAGIRD